MIGFKVGDQVMVANSFIGEITYIDYKKEEADVEWDESDGVPNGGVFPLKKLTFISRPFS